MKTKQPTFVERIHRLEYNADYIKHFAANETNTISGLERDDLRDIAKTIADEVERMKEANKRFEAQRAEKAKRKAKTAPTRTAVTS